MCPELSNLPIEKFDIWKRIVRTIYFVFWDWKCAHHVCQITIIISMTKINIKQRLFLLLKIWLQIMSKFTVLYPGNLLSRVLSGPVWRLPQGLHRQILPQSPWCHWKQKSKWPLDFCAIWRSGTVRQKVQLFTSMDPSKYQQLSVGRSGMCGEAGERWFVWTSTVASD